MSGRPIAAAMIGPQGRSGTCSLGGSPAVGDPSTGNVVVVEQVANDITWTSAFATAEGGKGSRKAEYAGLTSRGSGAVGSHEHSLPAEPDAVGRHGETRSDLTNKTTGAKPAWARPVGSDGPRCGDAAAEVAGQRPDALEAAAG